MFALLCRCLLYRCPFAPVCSQGKMSMVNRLMFGCLLKATIQFAYRSNILACSTHVLLYKPLPYSHASRKHQCTDANSGAATSVIWFHLPWYPGCLSDASIMLNNQMLRASCSRPSPLQKVFGSPAIIPCCRLQRVSPRGLTATSVSHTLSDDLQAGSLDLGQIGTLVRQCSTHSANHYHVLVDC